MTDHLKLIDVYFNCVRAIGSQFKKTKSKTYTSSSGGNIYVKYKKVDFIKNGDPEEANILNYLQVNVFFNMYSSSGFIYISKENLNAIYFNKNGIVSTHQNSENTNHKNHKIEGNCFELDQTISCKISKNDTTNKSIKIQAKKRFAFKSDKESPQSRFIIRLDSTREIPLKLIEFQNINIRVSFLDSSSVSRLSGLNSVRVNKNSEVHLTFPEYYLINKLRIKNANLFINTFKFLIISDLVLIEHSNFSFTRYFLPRGA